MKVNIQEKCREFNTFRQDHSGESFSRKELFRKMRIIGIRDDVVWGLIKSNVILTSRISGSTEKLYTLPSNPIHISIITKLYKAIEDRKKKYYPKSELEQIQDVELESDPIAILKAQGYEIRKPIGFDMDAFRKDHPDLYRKYSLYEEI